MRMHEARASEAVHDDTSKEKRELYRFLTLYFADMDTAQNGLKVPNWRC